MRSVANPWSKRTKFPLLMRNQSMLNPVSRTIFLVQTTLLLAVAALVAVFLTPSFAQEPQRAYSTPQAAVDALVAALKAGAPEQAIIPVLGPGAENIISSGDRVEDANALKRFLGAYDQMHRMAYDADGDVILYVGADNWPLPIPLVRKNNQWMFDTAAGEKELVYRRIGANELYTIDVLENLVQAQDEYAEQERERSGGAQYAQKIISDEGQRNGLYWPTVEGAPESPIGPLIAKAVSEGYRKGQGGKPVPFHGYYYRVLTAQGKNARGGTRRYVRNGRMTEGFAFLAYPAGYRTSGVMTFLVNQNGDVLQKDLGSQTSRLAQQIKSYDPDATWKEAVPGGIQPQELPPEVTAPQETQTNATSQS
jgi:hypothetical protein